MEQLSELEDSRKPSNGTRHDFREILVIAAKSAGERLTGFNPTASEAKTRRNVLGGDSPSVGGSWSPAVWHEWAGDEVV